MGVKMLVGVLCAIGLIPTLLGIVVVIVQFVQEFMRDLRS